MIGKVYLRKKVVVPQLIQVQESEPTSRNEVTVFHPPLQIESKLQFEKLIDQNLPIAIRKGTRECTKRSFYPLSHVVSFEKLSPFHKSFLTSLNNSYISTTLTKVLSNENWRQAMNKKWRPWRKIKLVSW